MKKTINNTIIAIAAIAAITFMTPAAFADGNHVATYNGAAVLDMQSSHNAGGEGGIIGGAISGAEASGSKTATSEAGAGSAMTSSGYTFTITKNGKKNGAVIGHGSGIVNDGSVAASASGKATGCGGAASAIAAGAIVQGSKSSLSANGGGATAGNVSGAAFLSTDSGNNASASGTAATGGYSETYSGKVDNTQFDGANTGNYAQATGDYTLAGGTGCVTSYNAQGSIADGGAISGGGANFSYTGNGAGAASTYSETTSYNSGGVSYKGAYSTSTAHVGPVSSYGK